MDCAAAFTACQAALDASTGGAAAPGGDDAAAATAAAGGDDAAAAASDNCKKIFCGTGNLPANNVQGTTAECQAQVGAGASSGTTLTISSLIVFLSAFYYC